MNGSCPNGQEPFSALVRDARRFELVAAVAVRGSCSLHPYEKLLYLP